MSTVTTQLEALVRETRKPESEIIALAVEAGLRELWRERVLGQFLCGEISREEAIEQTGLDWVALAERQQKAVQQDLLWATQNT